MTIDHDPEGRELLALETMLPALVGRWVLEIGCGEGRLTRRYAQRAGSVVAIDPDPLRIAAFERDRPVGRVEARAIGFLDDDLHLAEQSFDAIIFSWAL
jgi:SAM-dependent methyltransferase